MSLQYSAVLWNPQKKTYDLAIAVGVLLYMGAFVGIGSAIHPNATAETLLIRGFGTLAFLLLHIILAIGPLCRLNRRFLPLLYNRRHLGVTMFLCALVHGGFSLFQFHALGDASPLVSLFVSNTRYSSLAQFPFQSLGFFALLILYVMAATSHDFWLKNMTAPVWKRIHMFVYAAYALLVGHVTLGALQSETSPVLAVLMGAGLATLITLHVASAAKERRVDQTRAQATAEGFVEVCDVHNIQEKCAKVVTAGDERIAVFKYDGKISAVSNVCAHQGGPLGEGRVIDGCITCPWHGYQYLPDSGQSPPPFKELIPTYRARVAGNKVLVHPSPLPAGTPVEPARIAS